MSFRAKAAAVLVALTLCVVVLVVFASVRAWRERVNPTPVAIMAGAPTRP